MELSIGSHYCKIFFPLGIFSLTLEKLPALRHKKPFPGLLIVKSDFSDFREGILRVITLKFPEQTFLLTPYNLYCTIFTFIMVELHYVC